MTPILKDAVNVIGGARQTVSAKRAVSGKLRPYNGANPLAPAGLGVAADEWTSD